MFSVGKSLGASFSNGFGSTAMSVGFRAGAGGIAKFADGGFPKSGDLFFANENGVPEAIGRMGNRTAVANGDQIASGIAAGVSNANSRMEALLQRNNALMEQMLNKDFKAVVTPSATLGRVTEQSRRMYAKSTG